MKVNQVPYEMMRRLSGLRYFYKSTISDCLESVLAENKLQISDKKKAVIIARVSHAFEVLQ